MYQADLVGLLRTIFIIILIYYVVRFIGRIMLPFLLKRFVKKAQSNFEHQFKDKFSQSESTNTKQGEVEIKIPEKQKGSNLNFDDGEYVDFEEVKE